MMKGAVMMCSVFLAAAVLAGEVSGKAAVVQNAPPDIEQKPAVPVSNQPEEVVEVAKPDSDNQCVHKGRYFTVDIRKVAVQFQKRNLTSPSGKYIYFLSLCSPINCQFGDSGSPLPEDLTGAAACQYIYKQQRFVNLGKSMDYEFHVANLTYFYMVFNNGDTEVGVDNRRTRVDFFVGSADCSKTSTIEFTREENTEEGDHIVTYVFTVNLRTNEEDLITFNQDVEP